MGEASQGCQVTYIVFASLKIENKEVRFKKGGGGACRCALCSRLHGPGVLGSRAEGPQPWATGTDFGRPLPPRLSPLPGLRRRFDVGGRRMWDPLRGARGNTSSRGQAQRRAPGRAAPWLPCPPPGWRPRPLRCPRAESQVSAAGSFRARRRRPGSPNPKRSSRIPLAPRVLGLGPRTLAAERNNQIFIRFPARRFTIRICFLSGRICAKKP